MCLYFAGLFGEWLYKQLVDRNMTTQELATALGFTRATISNHVHGNFSPNRTSLRKYADYFGVNYWELYELVIVGKVRE